MNVVRDRQKAGVCRNQGGAQLYEFAAAIVLLTIAVLIPLLDLTIVPVRWFMAQGLANSFSRRLALCESYGQSCRLMLANPTIAQSLEHIGGITVESQNLELRVSRIPPNSAETVSVQRPGQIDAAWLPDGAKSPCLYSLEMTVKLLISPAILLHIPGPAIMGLNTPFPVVIRATHQWENLGRNPSTGNFFLNE